MKKNKVLIILLVIIFLCGMLDYVLTFVGQNVYGIIQEVNPVMIPIVEMPFIGMFLLRALFLGLICLFIYFYDGWRPDHSIWTKRIVWIIAVIEVLVILYHCTWVFYLMFLV